MHARIVCHSFQTIATKCAACKITKMTEKEYNDVWFYKPSQGKKTINFSVIHLISHASPSIECALFGCQKHQNLVFYIIRCVDALSSITILTFFFCLSNRVLHTHVYIGLTYQFISYQIFLNIFYVELKINLFQSPWKKITYKVSCDFKYP